MEDRADMTTQKMDNKEMIIQDVYQKASGLGSPVTINKYCGFTCWIRWMSGRIFCQHDRQFCSMCGDTWLRFTEPITHKDGKTDGVCSKTSSDLVTRTVICVITQT